MIFCLFCRSPIPLNLSLPDGVSDTPYRLQYNCHDVGSENLVLDQPIIP